MAALTYYKARKEILQSGKAFSHYKMGKVILQSREYYKVGQFLLQSGAVIRKQGNLCHKVEVGDQILKSRMIQNANERNKGSQ